MKPPVIMHTAVLAFKLGFTISSISAISRSNFAKPDSVALCEYSDLIYIILPASINMASNVLYTRSHPDQANVVIPL